MTIDVLLSCATLDVLKVCVRINIIIYRCIKVGKLNGLNGRVVANVITILNAR